MTPDELWEKYSAQSGHGFAVVAHNAFLAALKEYGQAVRDRDAEIAREYEAQGIACSAAISREPPP